MPLDAPGTPSPPPMMQPPTQTPPETPPEASTETPPETRLPLPPQPPPQARPAGTARFDVTYVGAIAAVLTTGFFLRLLLFTGPIGSDDVRYLRFAELFVRGQAFDDLDHAAGRLLFLVLMGIPAVLGGHAAFAALANVVFSLVTDVVVTVFAWRTLGRRAAAIVAVAMAFSPIHLAYTSTVLPDTLLTLFLVLAVMVVHRADRIEDVRRRLFALGAAGLIAGLAYGCKETAVLFFPPVGLYLFLTPKRPGWPARLVPFGAVVAGFLAFYLVDGLVYLGYTGDFFYKITATAAGHNAGIPVSDGILAHLGTGLRALDVPRLLEWAFLPLHVGALAMTAAIFLRPRHRIFSMVGLFVLLFLIFGTTSLSRLIPLPFQVRYLQPVVPFAALALAALAQPLRLGAPVLARWAVPAVLVLVHLVAGLPPAWDTAGAMYGAGYYRQARLALEILQDEDRTLYVDTRTLRDLPVFLPEALRGRVAAIPAEGPLPEGHYLLYPVAKRRRGVSPARMAEVEALPVRLRLGLDQRLPEAARIARDYRRARPVLVYEKVAADEDAAE